MRTEYPNLWQMETNLPT